MDNDGWGAFSGYSRAVRTLERVMGFEPTTFCLGMSVSTFLRPKLMSVILSIIPDMGE